MKKYAILILGLLVMTTIVAAPGKEPSHPLSHIHPIDEDFNMSEMRIFNASRVAVTGGLKLDGNQILDSGAVPILNYNDDDRRLELRNNDFGVTGNNITAANNISFNDSLRVWGGKVWIPEDNKYGYFYRKNLSEVLEDGNNATIYDINMNGNDIENLDELRTDGSGSDEVAVRDTANSQDVARFKEGGDVEVPNGNLRVGSDLILGLDGQKSSHIKEVTGIDAEFNRPIVVELDTSNNKGFRIERGSNNLFQIPQGSQKVEIPSGNLDVRGDNITGANAVEMEPVRVGLSSNAGSSGVALGQYSGTGTFGVAVGDSATSDSGVAVGSNAAVGGSGGVVVGKDAGPTNKGVIVGQGASGNVYGVVSLGHSATSSGPNSIAIGRDTLSSSRQSIAIGQGAEASSDGSVAIGNGTTASNPQTIRLGENKDVVIPGGNLDVSGNNITNIDWLKFEEGTSIDGNLTVNGSVNSSGNIDMNDNNIFDANAVEANRIYDPEDSELYIDDDVRLRGVDTEAKMEEFSDTSNGGSVKFRKARGTASSPSVVNSGDTLGNVTFRGYDGSDYTGGASISTEVTHSPTSGDIPGSLVFSTANLAQAEPQPRMWIGETGRVAVGERNLGGPDFALDGTSDTNASLGLYYHGGSDYVEIKSVSNGNEDGDLSFRHKTTGGKNNRLLYLDSSQGRLELSKGNLDVSNNNITRLRTLQFEDNITIGNSNTVVRGENSLAIGNDANVTSGAYDSLAIGKNSKAYDFRSVSIGVGSGSTNSGVAIGYNTEGYGGQGTAIGNGAKTNCGASTAIGSNSASQCSSTAVGNSASANNGGTSLGRSASAGKHAIAIGRSSSSSGRYGIGIGKYARASGRSAVAVGYNVSASEEDTIKLGGTSTESPRNVKIPGGNIELQGNRIVDTTGSDTVYVGDADSNTVQIQAGGSGDVALNTGDGGSGSTRRVTVTSSGGEADVDVQNSDVDLNGNSVTTSTGEVCIGDQCA